MNFGRSCCSESGTGPSSRRGEIDLMEIDLDHRRRLDLRVFKDWKEVMPIAPA